MSRYFLTPWELHNMLIEINYLTQFPVNIDKIPDKKLKIEIENTLKTKNNKKSIIGIHSVFSFSLEILSKIYVFFLIVPFYKKLCYGI
jgi:hypothetical protein